MIGDIVILIEISILLIIMIIKISKLENRIIDLEDMQKGKSNDIS